mmetsp:Transcript_116146/g.333527  ORF Transcript_116146/g.333527 Transcript_116146/m.333527 type:complete len:222 (+) Transcript_116146:447-1112(+)
MGEDFPQALLHRGGVARADVVGQELRLAKRRVRFAHGRRRGSVAIRDPRDGRARHAAATTGGVAAEHGGVGGGEQQGAGGHLFALLVQGAPAGVTSGRRLLWRRLRLQLLEVNGLPAELAHALDGNLPLLHVVGVPRVHRQLLRSPLPEIVLRLEVGACLEQDPGGPCVAALAGEVQGRVARVVEGRGRRPGLQEKSQDRGVAGHGGAMQCRLRAAAAEIV